VMEPRFSIVIPAFNEERYLPRLLDSIDRARERYGGDPDSVEVIVADNLSTDATAQIAVGRGCVVVSVEKRVIGAVRNGGARVARGEIVAFVDSDTQIHPETLAEIDRVLSDPRVIVGATGIRFERRSIGIDLTFAMLVIAGSLIRVAIGERPTTNVDTGVTFCRRRDFEEVGGYNEELLFAETDEIIVASRKTRLLGWPSDCSSPSTTVHCGRRRGHRIRPRVRSSSWSERSRFGGVSCARSRMRGHSSASRRFGR
jgi:glycosyltransferase involved in cell wall biosynthesis